MKDSNNIPVESATGETTSTSLSLMRRVKLRDPAAWHRMVELYAPLVWHWCRRAHLQPSDADDTIQEVFRTVDRKIMQFKLEEGRHTFRGWLKVITRNKVGDFIRRQQRNVGAVGGADEELAAAEDKSVDVDEMIQDEFGDLYRRVMNRVQVEFQTTSWKAFWMVVIEDRHPRDVAESLGVTTNAVYVAKSRILSRLREELGDM